MTAGWRFHANALTRCFAGAGDFDLATAKGGNGHVDNRKRIPSDFRRRRQLADTPGDHHLRLRHRAVELRAALELRLLRAADEPRVRLGPRYLCAGIGAAKSVVGIGPADRRRDCRPLRCAARDQRRRVAVRGRPGADALCRDAFVARSRRRRADRFWAFRLLVQFGAVGVFEIVAAGAARSGAWRRHRGRIVRPVSVRAVWRRHDR